LLSHCAKKKLSLEDAIQLLSCRHRSSDSPTEGWYFRHGGRFNGVRSATISPLEPGGAHDLPGGAKRRKQLAKGIEWTVVNGQVLMEKGEHTGAYPGKVAQQQRGAAMTEPRAGFKPARAQTVAHLLGNCQLIARTGYTLGRLSA
jgi:hypothetical protein